MKYSIIDLLRLIGSLVFFLYGMKLMSESLQKIAGDKMRTILGAMTSNRIKGVFTGLIITAVIQSSSATTVMIVSFVNAGLLSLTQSIGVIMGANIGTTVTAWLISIFGFKIDISNFALPIIGLSLPLLFSRYSRRRSIGELIIGFAIIFLGLAYLNSSVPDMNNNPEVLTFISKYSTYGGLSIILFMFFGILLTLVLQSSSATMALTLVMCYNGWIEFDMAVAMVLGQNIGTTITANIAALVANTTAKQTALAHLLFNVIGVIIALILFKPYENMVVGLMKLWHMDLPYLIDGQTVQQTNSAIPLALSIYHTAFNLINTLILIWFVPQLATIVKKIIRSKDEDDTIFKLQYINTGLLNINELSALQARKEINVFFKRTMRMYNMVRELLEEESSKNIEKLTVRIKKYENIADRMDEEIVTFLTRIIQSDVSRSTSELAGAMIKLVSRIESISDSCDLIAQYIELSNNNGTVFNEEMVNNLKRNFEEIDHTLTRVESALKSRMPIINIETERQHRNSFREKVEKLNIDHLKSIKKGIYKYKTGILYCDIFTEQEILSNHCFYCFKYIDEMVKSK